MLREIESLMDRLEPVELHEAIERVDDAVDQVENGGAWREFIEEHPELTEPTRLEVTDENVYDALVEIHAQELYGSRKAIHLAPVEKRRDFNFPCASGVWRLLMQRQELLDPTRSRESEHSDLMRVVAALKRLERSGRVVQEVRYVYGQRRSAPGIRREADGLLDSYDVATSSG